MRAFWDIAPCSLVGVTDVSEVRTASIPEGSDLHTRGRENLKSHSIKKGSRVVVAEDDGDRNHDYDVG
jgi:hypothetical protein